MAFLKYGVADTTLALNVSAISPWLAFVISSFALIIVMFHAVKGHVSRKAWHLDLCHSTTGLLNALRFLSGRESFLRELLSRSRPGLAFMGFCNYGVYLAVPGEQVCRLLRSSRQLVPCPSLEDALTVFFGLPGLDLRIFDHRVVTKFEGLTVLKTNFSDPSRRIMAHQRADFAFYFQGRHLSAVVTRFMTNLNTNFRDDPALSQKHTDLFDMYSFLFRHIFRAEVCALYGELIFTVCPNFCEDFMTFYDAFPTISTGMPKWLFPSTYDARKKMLENFKTWRMICHAKFNSANHDEQGVAYEPVWGSECIRKMVKRHEDMGFSDDGIASIMLGYLFVTVANSIPATIWMLLYILLDQDLAQRLELEIDHALDGPFELDSYDSSRRPLLHSVYCETLRLRIAGAVGRKCTDSDFSLGGCKIKRNIPVMFSNWLGSADDLFWNASDVPWEINNHPVETFWAERFLGDRRKALVKAGLAGNWFPFGGGASKCPGESLARHTILGSVVTVLRSLDVKLSDPAAAAKVGSYHRTFPFGSHAFDKQVPIIARLRQRLPSDGA